MISNFSIISGLKKALTGHLEQWPDFLEPVTYSVNNRVREATGYSGYELMFGRKSRLPIEAEALGTQ